MFPAVSGVLEEVYVSHREYLKGINDEVNIQSVTELCDEALYMLHVL